MKIQDYIDQTKLLKHIQDGYVHKINHPTLPLSLLSYTRKTVYDNLWDDVTTRTRGLIYDNIDGSVIARPFEKFFNLEDTLVDTFGETRPVFSEKLDGSLGIFYIYHGQWGVASKGSFTSVHAEWMNSWIASHIEEHGSLVWPVGYTPIFEMIAESVQTHVLNYEGKEDLVLVSLVNNETGEELPPMAIQSYAERNHMTVVEFYNMTLGAAVKLDRQNREGFVATYPRSGRAPLKVKIKHPTFLTNQKLVHQVSPKHLLESLEAGNADLLGDWQKLLPTHVGLKVFQWSQRYHAAYRTIHATAALLVHEILKNMTTRKEAAAFLMQPDNKPYAGICFALLDQKEGYKNAIWKLVGQRVQIENTIDGGE